MIFRIFNIIVLSYLLYLFHDIGLILEIDNHLLFEYYIIIIGFFSIWLVITIINFLYCLYFLFNGE